MTIAQIETKLQELQKSFSSETFIYDLLRAYGMPKASITRLRNGNLNLSKIPGEISWKKKLLFKEVGTEELGPIMEAIKQNGKALRHSPRFVVVTDYETLLAWDTKTEDTLDCPIGELAKHYDFFLPWAGMEKAQHKDENPADVKAAEKMAKLFDEIKKDNPHETPTEIHNLNVFLSRLLFCFFAEDTDIFSENLFTNAVSSTTQPDGSDLHEFLNKLFGVMNTEHRSPGLSFHFNQFPYVNGGLFREEITSPKFSRRSRKMVIECGGLSWAEINPDIFGSMIQAVVSPEHRGGLGMHYTSVPNIMKVIEPLFLNELYEEFDAAKGHLNKLNALLKRIWNIKLFDPACGSGNFLIIAYKELRKLEMALFEEIDALKGNLGSGKLNFGEGSLSQISLSHFYGIELDDFAHEVAILSLWLAEHQMNQVFFAAFGRTKPALPLEEAGNIVHGNATRLDWEVVCPKVEGDEIYILGNPPYRGKKEQTNEQKEDLKIVCRDFKNYKNLDYISCWFIKGADYLSTEKIKLALVTTNSITQGEQVGLLWPYIFDRELEILFAHTSFMWENNAKKKAGVSVVIIGVQQKTNGLKKLFIPINKKETTIKSTKKINPYLAAGSDVIVYKRSKTLSDLPKICNGSMPNDSGYFFLNELEYKVLPDELKRFYKPVLGAREFFHGIKRYCLWLEKNNLNKAIKHSKIREVIESVKKYRLNSKRDATRKLADSPHSFGEVRYKKGPAIFVPGLSAEKREYIPIGFLKEGTIVTNLAQVIYKSNPLHFGIVSSKINNVWVRATSGYFKKDIRYSPLLSYNTLPIPAASKSNEEAITKCVFNLLEEREKHPEKTLAQLYDPDKMPDGLRAAHHELDLAVERCYRSRPFESDEERLEHLFKLYEKMIKEEAEREAAEKKKSGKNKAKK